MGRFLTPDAYVKSIQSISPEGLKAHGISGLIIDIDNTLAPTHTRNADKTIKSYILHLKEGGIKAVIVSNAKRERVEHFCSALDIDYVYKALKPLKKGYREAMNIMGLPSEKIAIVGDQLFTDILGGNLLGMKSILIKPIDPDEPLLIKLKRLFEKPFMRGKIFLDDF